MGPPVDAQCSRFSRPGAAGLTRIRSGLPAGVAAAKNGDIATISRVIDADWPAGRCYPSRAWAPRRSLDVSPGPRASIVAALLVAVGRVAYEISSISQAFLQVAELP